MLPETKLNLSDRETSTLTIIPIAFHYKDSIFRARIAPLLGMHITRNSNGNITKRWFGAEFQAMMGKHLSVYGSLQVIFLFRDSYCLVPVI